MNQFLLLTFLFLIAMVQTLPSLSRNESPCLDKGISLSQFQWENWIILMFAQNSDTEPYQHQMNEFSPLKDEHLDRDLVLISVFDEECAKLDGKIISESSAHGIQSKLSPPKDGYSILLIGKDGGVKLKQDDFLAPDKLFSVIDRMPMRQREMRKDGYRN